MVADMSRVECDWNEITMFLDFICVSILDGVEMAEALAGIQDPLAH